MTNIAEREAAVFMRTGGQRAATLVRGSGTHVWDEDGKQYLDFVAGISTVSLGHGSPVVLKALQDQADQLIHVSNIFYTIPQIELGEILVKEAGLDRIFFVNSGAEANESGIKLVRKWGREHRNGATEIITAQNAFHGRTLATITATGTPQYSEPFAPLPHGFVQVPFNDIDAMRNAITENTCAIMLEPIQAEGGVNVPDKNYFPEIRRLCDESNIALFLDEIQTGMGRTGKMFGFQHYEIQPDVITLAKGLGGGVPVGAILANEKLSVFTPGDHGTTFGGQPLTTAVALAVTKKIIDNDIPSYVKSMGEHLINRLRILGEKHQEISEVRGQGLLIALEFKSDLAAELVKNCRDRGLLLNNVRPNALRFMPPLTVTSEEIDNAALIVEESLEAVISQ